MEFFGPNFKEDFPFFPTIFLENNPKQDSFNLMGNSNALMQNYNAIGYQHKHGHVHGRDDGRLADNNHRHHQGVFPADLNYNPAPADDYHHSHQLHDRRHHNGHQNNDDEPMVPFDHVLAFHDLNMMPEEEEGAAADPAADVDEKGKEKDKKKKEKVVEAQPVEESAQETNHAHTKTPMVKGQWSPQEDMRLVQLVKRHGVKKWSYIAQKLGGRVGKQCRERWHNHLRSNIKKGEWSLEEDTILIEAHKELGNKWCQIAKHLPGRTENTIKNHWNATLRKRFPRDESYGDGSTLLRNYILSVTSSSSLAKNNADKRKYTRRNKKLAYDGKQVAADSNMLERNLNLEVPLRNEHGDQLIGPCGCGMSYLLFGHDQTDNAGTSKEKVEVARKEMDLLEMISQRRA